MTPEPPRTLLSAPADAPPKLTRACDSKADIVIADLEDAVAPGQKAAAKQSLAALSARHPLMARAAADHVETDHPDACLRQMQRTGWPGDKG